MKLFYVDEIFQSEFEAKKSKFISFLFPYSKFAKFMAELRVKHPKAVHFVYAYRYLNEYEQIVENQSDDGEPKSSSGKPTLSVMQGKALINSAIISVRYFGGIKLGVGGLVRAYSDSANLVINQANLSEYIKKESLYFFIEYSKLSKFEYVLKNYNLKVEKEFLENGVNLTIEAPKEVLELLKKAEN